MNWYPLTFVPILKEKVWGGNKLHKLFNKGESATAPVGESWEIADLSEGQSIVNHGELKGKSLQEVIAMDPEAFLGKSVYDRFGQAFPLLIKFIDAAKDLSIQVHPTDETSPTGTGKTEMWYIMQADPGALLTVGFNEELNKEGFRQHIDKDTVEQVMNTHEVQPGDGFFIHAGLIHAIGAGVVLAEIQQTSDVTYRVYDYNRPDTDGNMRELHVEESLEVLDYSTDEDFKLEYDRSPNQVQTVKHHKYFKTEWMHLLNAAHSVIRNTSFTILMVVDGSLEYEMDGDKNTLATGQTLLIPAACKEVILSALDCKFLEVYL